MEIDKVYSILLGAVSIIAKIIDVGEDTYTVEYAMSLMPTAPNQVAPLPLDKLGEVRVFTLSKYAISAYWEPGKRVTEMFEEYRKQRAAEEVGLIYAASMNDIKK